MLNRWEKAPSGDIDQLVHQLHLVGMEEDLLLWGGDHDRRKRPARCCRSTAV